MLPCWSAEMLSFRADRQELLLGRQRLRDRPAERRARPAGARADARDCFRRHRSVGRLADGPVRGRLRHAVARRTLPIPLAAAGDAGPRRAGGVLNGVLITRLRLPPLIVTLGTFSLFRGLAEGMTGGVENFTAFPGGFLFLGQGYCSAAIPPQLPICSPSRRSAFGGSCTGRRSAASLFAIGFSPEGARYAGIPVERRLMLVYRAVGPGGEPGGDHLRRPSGPGQGRRRHRLRADGDHGGRARRHVDLRRPRHGFTARCSACSRSSILQNGLRLAALPPSWRES